MSNKLKKVVAVLLTATMVMAMSMTVLAAPVTSATATGTVRATGARDANGNSVTVTIGTPEQMIDTAGARAALGNDFVEGMEVVDVVQVTAPAGTVFPLTVTFSVPTVVSTTKVAVLHYTGGKWVPETCKAGNGTITATFPKSLSPVAFVVDKNTAAGKDGKSNGGSPKTGEFATTSVLAVLAVLAIGGAVVCYRKREEVR